MKNEFLRKTRNLAVVPNRRSVAPREGEGFLVKLLSVVLLWPNIGPLPSTKW